MSSPNSIRTTPAFRGPAFRGAARKGNVFSPKADNVAQQVNSFDDDTDVAQTVPAKVADTLGFATPTPKADTIVPAAAQQQAASPVASKAAVANNTMKAKAVTARAMAAADQAQQVRATSIAVNASKWYQYIKDALYAIEQFFNEKKSGQYPAGVDPILRFIKVILTQTAVAEQFADQMKAILSHRPYLDLMIKGLIIKPQSTPQPGEFFMSPVTKTLTFNIDHSDSLYTFCLREVLSMVSIHGGKVDNKKKANDVNFYVLCMFSQAFSSYVTQIGPTFMEKPDRDKIVGNTIVEKVSAPYNFGEKASALKELLLDAADDPDIAGFAKDNIGPSAVKAGKSILKSFNPNSIGDAQGALMDAITTRKVAPIKEALKGFVTSMAGSSHAKDKIKSYNQE